MRTRVLGRNGPRILAVGLGCMVMSGDYGPADAAGSIATIHRALDIGVNFLDTVDIYGLGGNEELVGKALRGSVTPAFLRPSSATRSGRTVLVT